MRARAVVANAGTHGSSGKEPSPRHCGILFPYSAGCAPAVEALYRQGVPKVCAWQGEETCPSWRVSWIYCAALVFPHGNGCFPVSETHDPIGFAARSRVLLQGWSGCVKES
jgi:hypothetical protein